MRDGNAGTINIISVTTNLVLEVTMRDGNIGSSTNTFSFIKVLEVTMRDGNPSGGRSQL